MRALIALIANLLLLVFWPLHALRRARAAPRGAWLTLVVKGPVVEIARVLPFWRRPMHTLSLQSLRRLVELAVADARVSGIVLRIESFQGGSARATSLREILLAVRKGNKQVVVFLPNGGGTLALYIASAADRVILGPETHLDATGFAVESSYLRGLLDQVGLEPDVFAKGRFKTAGEFLTSKSMSEPQREQIGKLLDVAKSSLIDALAQGRRRERAEVEGWIDAAPWSARAAVEAGIADDVCYPDELPKLLDETRADGAVMFPAGRYFARRRPRWRPIRRPRRIAVVDVNGPIVSDAPFALLPVAAEEPVCEALSEAREDPRVLGAIVNVSSRGGSALASDRMLHELRRLAEKKPTVAYLGDVAASGGYMIAVGAHAIVAQPTSVTGSIGVVAARVVAAPLLRRLGINVEVVKRGAHADAMSASRHLDPVERARFEQQIDEIYRSFLEAVAEGRAKPVEEIEKLAQGRVWAGRDAHEHGLVDHLGGFEVALAELRRRIGPAGAKLEPVVVGPEHLRAPSPLLRVLRTSARALGGESLLELGAMAIAEPRATAWLWSEVAKVGD